MSLSHIFNGFHDGEIISAHCADSHVRLRVRIEYLAEMIQPHFSSFYLDLIQVQSFSYDFWTGEQATYWEDIVNCEPEISSCERLEDGRLNIKCLHFAPEDGPGANLILEVDNFRLYDEELNVISVEYFKELVTSIGDKSKVLIKSGINLE